MSPAVARIILNGRGELRVPWRFLLFLPLFLLATALFAAFQPLFQRLTGLSAAAAGAAGALFGALVAGAVMLLAVDHRRPGALGFGFTRQVPRELAFGVALAGGALALVIGGLAATRQIWWTPDPGSAVSYTAELGRDLVLWGIAAAAEEAIFRGYAFQLLVQGLGAAPATLLASAGFALAHRANPNVDALAFLNIFLAGVMLSAAYLRTRSLWFATAVHTGWNWTMGTVLALPVSGLVIVDTPLYDGHSGPLHWLTGGAFGPEGGLAATVAFAIVLAAVLLLPLREAARMKELRPLVDTRLSR